MPSVDTAWLRMDRPSNLMMICGVLIFRERLSLAKLKRTLTDRFLTYRRFRQRAVQSSAGAYWETDTSFNLAAHAKKQVAVAGPRGEAGIAGIGECADVDAARS